jgi:putative flavoprotein involved in K+ transport
MRKTYAIIIGAGQAGLAMSYCLGALGIDHVVLERGNVAERWRSERWDSLRLLTPNWMNRLPGSWYQGLDPDGFMTSVEFASFLERYARESAAPVIAKAEVRTVRRGPAGYRVETRSGAWHARCVVIATGHCDLPSIPEFARSLPPSICQLTPTTYRNPGELPHGGVLVVGASASGVQLAEEIQNSGRQVTISVGRHLRMPRLYRGRDIMSWFDRHFELNGDVANAEELEAARAQPSPQLIGRPKRINLDLGVLRELGIRLLGRMSGVDGGNMRLKDDLRSSIAESQARMERLLQRFDILADAADAPAEAWPAPFAVEAAPASFNLADNQVSTVLWATGFRRNYAWLRVPVVDARGEIIHTSGVTPAPGLYVTGLRFLRRRDASFIAAVAGDALAVATQIQRHLNANPSVAA